jgi:hypothetical protein
LWFEPDGYPSSLALCIIDSIYSTGAHYSSVRKIVDRYRSYRVQQGGNADTDGVDELRATIDELGGPDPWATTIGNRRPTSTRDNAPLKSVAVAEIVDAFSSLGINTAADLRAAATDRALGAAKDAWRSVPGQRSGITWEYALMLARVPGVKADRMITRYVARAIGVSIDRLDRIDAAQLVKQAAESKGWNVIHLDHAIWRHESGRPVNRDGDPDDTEPPEEDPIS